MPGPQGIDVQETDPQERDQERAYRVAVLMVALITFHLLVCLRLSVCWITGVPSILAIAVPCGVLAIVQCFKKLIRAISRTRANGDIENNGGTAADAVEASHDRASVGSDGGIVRQRSVVTIPSSSSSPSGSGGVSAGSGVVTAADVELGGASHHRRGEIRRGRADMSGEAIRDENSGKNT